MKNLTAILMISAALIVPQAAYARNVKISAQIASFYGPGTYLAIYITKPDGSYNSTIWLAGTRQQYYGHLRGWVRGVSQAGVNINGITGASVGGGQTLTVNANIADSLINAGYSITVDSAVQGYGEYPADASVPLSATDSGVPTKGQGFVQTLTVKM